MRSVGLKTLKNKLSEYVRLAAGGLSATSAARSPATRASGWLPLARASQIPTNRRSRCGAMIATAPSAGRRLEPDAHDINAAIKSGLRAIKAIIPSISTRKVGLRLRIYAERNLVERYFNAIKHYEVPQHATKRTARHFLAGLHLVCAHRLAQMTIDPS